jgi:GT2 family glycosyltransferase
MFLSIIIATNKRPDSMKELYNNLKLQELMPNEVIIVDSSNTRDINYSWFQSNWELKEIYNVEPTLPKQRNIGISMLNNKSDIIIFLDDDVLLDNDYLKNINKIYEDDKINEIAGVGGFVIGQDENFKPFQTNPIIKNGHQLYNIKTLYGCNMSYRKQVVDKIKFDENLLLYAFLEDKDYSLSANQYGLVVRTKEATLKHLRVPTSRISESKFGFAIVGNNYYVMNKHNCFKLKIFFTVMKLVIFALVNSILYKSKRTRFKGSYTAFKQIISGNFDTKNILMLD